MLNTRLVTIEDIPIIRDITFKVWPETYSAILSPGQIDYMLAMMYSEASLQNQMNQLSHHFILCYNDDIPCGFASYNRLHNEVYKLQKIYILSSTHRKGAGNYLFEKICSEIKNKEGKILILNVNRNNPAVHFYKKLGFIIKGEEDIDIGNGFYMNDYVMEKKI